MNQLYAAVVVGLVGVICIMDSRLLGRLSVERPLIGATMVGIVLGDIPTALAAGATLELMSIGLINVGASMIPDMNMGSIVATAFVILTGAGPEAALTIAVPVAMLGQALGLAIRMVLSAFSTRTDALIDEGKFTQALHLHIIWGNILYALMYFVPIFLAIYIGTDFVQQLVNAIPAWVTSGLSLAGNMLTALGMALLLTIMLTKSMTIFFLLGFFGAAFLGLNVTAMAIFAVLIGLLLMGLKFRDGGATRAAAQDLDQYDPLEDDE
ncbi:PTS mannose/fructose/sorbose/N-acetylgalactosamine transporter subunit IIC [Thermophilibacter immobilis]|uniref:PTS sugar transporter subunit IIC n=1 Tax=Thermophilibacter immobilis TaxID=2779519 RepID=A0A7S7M8G3_9ACTN|nr:PTS sugar transporter subunit IIC [Thermophilibacter immobilis]QOY60568.1 PTS sugar transporter subunit IIC [Thermophilibacter immobilis]